MCTEVEGTDSDRDANSVDTDDKAAVEALERRRQRTMGAVHELGGWAGWWVTTCVVSVLAGDFTAERGLWRWGLFAAGSTGRLARDRTDGA